MEKTNVLALHDTSNDASAALSNPAPISSKPTRALLRYHGGKWKLAPWIVAHLPDHRVYVEPFAGAASVLLKKPRSRVEVVNDLDSEIVNLFRVVRDQGPQLQHLLRHTPFAREELSAAYEPCEDPVERARRLVVRASLGRNPGAATTPSRASFRAYTKADRSPTTDDWQNYPNALSAIIERWQGVVVEHKDACDVLKLYDGPDTVHYVDPPYVLETRDLGRDYRHEMSLDDHARLADVLHTLRGAVVLSGYDHPTYRAWFKDWHRVERVTRSDGRTARTEVLWCSRLPIKR